MKLRDAVPKDFLREFMDTRAAKFLDVEVIKTYGSGEGLENKPFPQKRYQYRNIYTWWELANGYAVAWNESPRTGWSFPVVRIEERR